MTAAHPSPGAGDAVGEATLELLDAFPAYTDFLWSAVTAGAELRGRVLEIGCGIGSITRRILGSSAVQALDAVDVEPSYVERVAREVSDPRLRVICARAEEFQPEAGAYDGVVSINVLEHVADDPAAFAAMAKALRPGGECLLLVPAHPALFSSLDRALSHHRRYTRSRLTGLAWQTGLEVRRIDYWNPLGALGWWLNGKVLRRRLLPRGQVAAYARWGILLSRWADRLNPVPLGISLIGRFAKPYGAGT